MKHHAPENLYLDAPFLRINNSLFTDEIYTVNQQIRRSHWVLQHKDVGILSIEAHAFKGK